MVRMGLTGRSYDACWSTNLLATNWTRCHIDAPGTGTNLLLSPATNFSPMFYRTTVFMP